MSYLKGKLGKRASKVGMKKVSACERELHMEVSQIKVELADIEVKIEGLRYVS